MNANLELIDNIKPEGDLAHTSNFGLFESDVYGFTIDQAYVDKSSGGADFMDLKLVTPQGRVLSQKVYFTSGTSKGNKITYSVKDKKTQQLTGEEKYLPGFTLINDLVTLITGEGLSKLQTIPKLVKCWDYDAKKEIPQSKDVCTDLHGHQIALAIQENTIMKRVNQDGNWVESKTESKRENEIVKAFNKAGQTLVEFTASEEASWIDGWIAKNKGQVRDRTGGKAKVSTDGTGVKKTIAFT